MTDKQEIMKKTKVTQSSTNGVNGTMDSKKLYTPDQLDAALWNATDILQRVLVPFVLLGQTAEDVKNNPERLNPADGIYIGFTKGHVIPELLSTLRTFATNRDLSYGMDNFRETDSGFEWEHQGVPVKVKVIQRKYKYFERPDIKLYRLEEYNIPNPFDEYWKARYLIK